MMMSKNKYNACGVWHDLLINEELLEFPTKHERRINNGRYVYFGSQHEYEVFLAINENYSLTQIKYHLCIPLMPSTPFSKETNWRIDFVVMDNDESFLIEAKGYGTREFALKLGMISYFQPELFRRLILVFPQKNVMKNKFVRNNPSIKHRAYSLADFKKIISEYPLKNIIEDINAKEEADNIAKINALMNKPVASLPKQEKNHEPSKQNRTIDN